MHLRRLQLSGFRNYQNLDLTLPTGNLVFLGGNAQGKSNLLEAVYMLASGRSARAGSEPELIAWQSEAEGQLVARLVGSVERRAGPVQLEAIVIASGGPQQASRAGKRLRVNGIPRRASDFVGQLRAVLFTAEDMAIVTGAPSERRRYLDSMLSQRDRRYYGAISRYARILQQRNAGLKRVKEGLASPDEMAFWDEALVAEGSVILEARIRACAMLGPLAGAFHRELSGEAMESLDVEYSPRVGDEGAVLELDGPASAQELAGVLKAGIASLRRREVAAGMSLVGPHRDEVLIRINGSSAASFGSRAQVRTATLALRLAEARLLQHDIADPPVLLLDDILSELDERRRRSVLVTIADFDQVWFTATDGQGLDPDFLAAAAVYKVAAGEIVTLA